MEEEFEDDWEVDGGDEENKDEPEEPEEDLDIVEEETDAAGDDNESYETMVDEKINNTRYHVEQKIVPNELRVTTDKLTKFNMTRIVGIRIEQISKTGNRLAHSILGTPTADAIEELKQGVCPLCIKRKVGENEYEIWDPREMVLPSDWNY